MSQQNSTGLPFGNSHLIRCKEDGSYEEVQCSGSTGFCWCVDQNGSKLEGTETRGALKCPALGMFCDSLPIKLSPSDSKRIWSDTMMMPAEVLFECSINFVTIQCSLRLRMAPRLVGSYDDI